MKTKNIYQMYEANGNRVGFFLRKNSWSTMLAKVIRLSGVEDGQPIPGKPPYYGTPKTSPFVEAELYRAVKKEDCLPENYMRTDILPSPGTYNYEMLD